MEETLFEQHVARRGWSLEDQVEILLEYIGNQKSPEAFREFLGEQE